MPLCKSFFTASRPHEHKEVSILQRFFKTGDIATFNNVTADTVRYYDKEKLVTPNIVKDNKYRYYTLDDALRFNNVTLFRELDVSLQSIKKWLTFSNVDEALTFQENHLDDLRAQQRFIEQKINFLEQFNRRIETFQKKPLLFEYVEGDFIYICRSLSFTADEDGFHIDNPTNYTDIDDIFWTKTSILGFVNTLEHSDSPQYGHAYCSNIIASDCSDIEKIQFNQALRYNYVGNPFANPSYLNDIKQELIRYCTETGLTPTNDYYEIYYLTQHVNDTPQYYIHLYFPVTSDDV